MSKCKCLRRVSFLVFLLDGLKHELHVANVKACQQQEW